MGRVNSVVLILMLCCACQGSSNLQPEPVSAAISLEDDAINQVFLKSYQLILFEAGANPNHEMLSSVFIEDAVFKNFRKEKLSSVSLD
jgi:hypothetical protein